MAIEEEGFAHLVSAAMQVGADGADGEGEGFGDLEVGALLLMVEDEDGALDGAEGLEVEFDEGGELVVFELVFGAGAGVFEEVFPGAGVGGVGGVGEGGVAAVFAAAALPLVLGDVDGDAVEVGADEGLSAEGGEGAVEAEKDVLGEVVEVVVAAGEACERAEDHGLVFLDDVLEGGLGGHAGLRGLDLRVDRKFQGAA